MEIRRFITGTADEMNAFFEEGNSVRSFVRTEGKFEVILRVNDSFREPNTKTIKAFRRACSKT